MKKLLHHVSEIVSLIREEKIWWCLFSLFVGHWLCRSCPFRKKCLKRIVNREHGENTASTI